MKIRLEKDSLGEMEVPANAYYGPQTARAVRNFPVSALRLPPEMITATAFIKAAAARSHHELELLDQKKAEAIERAAQEIARGEMKDEFVVDVFQAGAGTSFHMNVNEVIANRASELLGGKKGNAALVHPNDHVNMAQSTNDVIPTAMRLACLMLSNHLLVSLQKLQKTLETRAAKFAGIRKAGRTHLQDAVPMRLGQEFGGYAAAIKKARLQISASCGLLLEIGIGGSAVGTGVNTHPDYRKKMTKHLSRLTGFRLKPSENLFEAMQSMGPFTQVSASLRNLAVECVRIANDLRLLSSGPSTGLGEINLPAVQPGSSIMPGKVNPVMAEMLNMVCFHVIGADTTIMMAAQAGQLELNVMMPVLAYNLLLSLRILTSALDLFREKCVAGITANSEACARYAESTLALATLLNPYIGYMKAAEIAKESLRTEKTIREIVVERGLLDKQALGILFPEEGGKGRKPPKAGGTETRKHGKDRARKR